MNLGPRASAFVLCFLTGGVMISLTTLVLAGRADVSVLISVMTQMVVPAVLVVLGLAPIGQRMREVERHTQCVADVVQSTYAVMEAGTPGGIEDPDRRVRDSDPAGTGLRGGPRDDQLPPEKGHTYGDTGRTGWATQEADQDR